MKKVKQNEKTKKCANPDCTKEHFTSKSGKKKFCSVYCKNQASYKFRLANYPWYQNVIRSLKKNIAILEYLHGKGAMNLVHEQLVTMGFNFDVSLFPYVDQIHGKVFRYENLCLRQISKIDYELIKVNSNGRI